MIIIIINHNIIMVSEDVLLYYYSVVGDRFTILSIYSILSFRQTWA